MDDSQIIRDTVPLVGAISNEVLIRGANVVRGYRQQSMTIRGVEAPYGKVRNMSISSGRWISGQDDQSKTRVAVLGAKAATKLFGEIPPVGETISINGLQFEVAGLLESKTQISNYNTPDNECVFIPLTAASLLKDIKYPEDIVWMPANPMFRKQAIQDIRATLGRVHNFSPNDERALQVIVFNEYMRIIDTMSIASRCCSA